MIANTLKKTYFYIVQVPNIYKNDSVLVYQSEDGEYQKVEELNQEFTKWYESLSEKEAEELNVALYGEDVG